MTPLRLEDAETITASEHREIFVLVEAPEVTVTWTRYGAGEPGPDPHVHREHVDAFYVLEGELTFVVGPDAETRRVGPGGIVAVPPNVAHTYLNASTADATWLNMHAPDTGFAHYLRDLRDGRRPHFDQFEPPEDGGLPAAEAVITDGEPVALPQLSIAETDADSGRGYTFAAAEGGVVEIVAPSSS
ncbi:MAG TPA: cupin domain-containing protein [Solirubrobacteraceae bacterium]|nr:cupin domain-containing protein [Solirubrobacteraceae bacterium]